MEKETKETHHNIHDKEHDDHVIHHGHKQHEKNDNVTLSTNNIILIFGALLLLVVLYNIIQTTSFSSVLDKAVTDAKEAAILPKIGLVTITSADCKDCYDIKGLIGELESAGANITANKELDFSSEEAITAIAKYNLQKIPALIVLGETNKSSKLQKKLNELGKETDGNYIILAQGPPYISTESGDVKGKARFIYLKTTKCDDCLSLSQVYDQLLGINVKFASRVEVDADSVEGQRLLGQYSIKKVPTIIMDKELSEYPEIIATWEQLGTVEKDGTYVVREISPPYYSLDNSKIVGLVTLIVLSDESCDECYDGSEFHKPILQRMGVSVSSEEEVDINSKEGKQLVKDYNITKVPTVILKGDMQEYPTLVRAWGPVGTSEQDGSYVFRLVEIAQQPYKDLDKDEVITPTPPPQQ